MPTKRKRRSAPSNKRRYKGRKPTVRRHAGDKKPLSGGKKKSSSKKNSLGVPKKYPGKYKGGNKNKKNDNKKNDNKKGPSKPKPPSIQDFLMGDSPYQSGLSDLAWALEQFKIENAAARGDAQAAFGSAMDRMNFDRGKDLEFMKNDFGSRGLVFSGLYPDAVSDYNEEFSMGVADLNRDLASQMRDLQFDLSNMQQSTEMSKRDLRLDAIRRRAEEVQSQQFNFGSKPGGGGGGSNKSGGGSKQSSSGGGGSRIDRLQDKGLDKSQIVARLTGTKDNSGGARQLSNSQLRNIGFGNKFITNLRDRKSGVRKRRR